MDSINSSDARKVHPSENMQRLEKAITVADQRLRMRRSVNARVSISLQAAIAAPVTLYLMYHFLAPSGVMQNFKATNGAYMFWLQNFLYPIKSATETFRPEMYFKEMSGSLVVYTKKIEQKRAAGEATEGVHHPKNWL